MAKIPVFGKKKLVVQWKKTTLEIQRLHRYTWIYDSKLFGIAFDINISSDPSLGTPKIFRCWVQSHTCWVHSQGMEKKCPQTSPNLQHLFDRATGAVQASRLEPISLCWNLERFYQIATALVSLTNAWAAKNCKLRCGKHPKRQSYSRRGYSTMEEWAICSKISPQLTIQNTGKVTLATQPDHVPQRLKNNGKKIKKWEVACDPKTLVSAGSL